MKDYEWAWYKLKRIFGLNDQVGKMNITYSLSEKMIIDKIKES